MDDGRVNCGIGIERRIIFLVTVFEQTRRSIILITSKTKTK